MRTLYSLALLITAGIFPTLSFADNPLEWYLRNNGWGWGDGYHAKNNCVRVGPMPRAYAPVANAPMWYSHSAAMPMQSQPQPMYQQPPQNGPTRSLMQPMQPTPAKPPETIPPPMRGPSMNPPMGANDNRSAQRYYFPRP